MAPRIAEPSNYSMGNMESISKFLEEPIPPPALQPKHHHELLHIAMVPYPLQGHINPMMQFAKALIAKHNAKVSFINIKHHHDRIQKTRNFHPSESHPDRDKLQFLCVDNGLADDFDYTDLSPRFHEFHASLTLSMKEPLKQLLQNLNQESPPISCVVFGSFLPEVHMVSAQLKLPSFFFWTQSASVFSMYYHAPLLKANGFFPCTGSPETNDKLVSYVPGVPPLHPSSFPTLLHIHGISDPQFSTIRDQFSILPNCQGVIVNSFKELEKDAYQALQEELPFPVSFVGPLIPSAFLEDGDVNDTSVGASLLEEKIECMEWLDRQKTRSVVYVSFGSLFHPSAEDLESIANGIKHSKQPFLWVIRPKSTLMDVAEILPKGFLDETKQYGLIIPWAPQVQVLSHPSVGAFLTHSGWNSTLESVSMGVPMIPCPLKSDQPTNCTYVCELWKIGMALKRHVDGTISSLDVERVLRTVLQEGEGEEMRRRATELRDSARKAVRSQGSSCTHMQEFIQSVRKYDRRAI